MFAGLIASMSYVFAATGGGFGILVAVQGLFVFWVLIEVLLAPARARFLASGISIWIVLSIVLVGNLVLNGANYDDRGAVLAAAHVLGILCFAFAMQWAGSSLQPDRILAYLAWWLTPLIMVALAIALAGDRDVRANPLGVHPNWWGELAFGFIICSLALGRLRVKVPFITIGVGLMYLVQSRGAILAAGVAVSSFWILGFRPVASREMRRLTLALGAVVGGALLISAMGWWPQIMVTVEDRILLLNDPYRGRGTGLTGRAVAFLRAWSIFVERPLFGLGFDTLPDVHNGFLRWAAEGGIVLLGVMLTFIALGLIRAWRSRNDLLMAALLGSIAYLMTYPRGLNLNVSGVIFLMALFPWKTARESE